MPHLPLNLAKYARNNILERTIRKFRLHWNNYNEGNRKFLRGGEIEQKSLHEHLLNNDRPSFEEDISICSIDNHDPPHSYQRVLLDEDPQNSGQYILL